MKIDDREQREAADLFWAGLTHRGRPLGWGDMTRDEQERAAESYERHVAKRARARRELEINDALPRLRGRRCAGVGVVTRKYLEEHGVDAAPEYLVLVYPEAATVPTKIRVDSVPNLRGLLNELKPADTGLSCGARETRGDLWNLIHG